MLARPYICRLMSLSLVIWPSVWPFGHGDMMALRTAATSGDRSRAKFSTSRRKEIRRSKSPARTCV